MERPKLKIPRTKSEWIFDVVGYFFYFGSILFLIIIWGSLPKEVPGHYNAVGEVTRWGSKWELVLSVGVGAFILVILQTLEKFPEIYNYPKSVNKSNAKDAYLIGRKLINQLKNICLILFSFLLLLDVAIAFGWKSSLGKIFLPAVLISLAIPIVIAIMRLKKTK